MRSVKHGGKKPYKYRARKSASKKENNRLKKKTKNVVVKSEIMSQTWSQDLSVQQNLRAMGLAYDPNKLLQLSLHEPSATNMDTDAIGDLNKAKALGSVKTQRIAQMNSSSEVVHQLEKAVIEAEQKQGKDREIRLSKDDVRFCIQMIEKHGLDFKAMSRDPDNIWQFTGKQIQRKVNTFKKTSAYKKTLVESMEI